MLRPDGPARAAGARIHVVYLAVDGFHHYGLDDDTTYAQRVEEIERRARAVRRATARYEIAYGDQDLIEKLDTLPRRELVDRFETVLNEHRPELLLLPALPDYDQDHQAVFHAAHAAARPIAAAVRQVACAARPRLRDDEDPVGDRAAAALRRVRRHHRRAGDQARGDPSLRDDVAALSPHIRSLESVRALATIRGAEIGVEAAEAFAVLRTTLLARATARGPSTLPASSAHAVGSRSSDGLAPGRVRRAPRRSP